MSAAPRLLAELGDVVTYVAQLEQRLAVAEQRNALMAAHVAALQAEATQYLDQGLRLAGEICVHKHALSRAEEQLGLVGRELDDAVARAHLAEAELARLPPNVTAQVVDTT